MVGLFFLEDLIARYQKSAFLAMWVLLCQLARDEAGASQAAALRVTQQSYRYLQQSTLSLAKQPPSLSIHSNPRPRYHNTQP